MTNNVDTKLIETIAPNGFHVYIPETGSRQLQLYFQKEALICLIALYGDFYVDRIKIPENQFFLKLLRQHDSISISKKGDPAKTDGLLILHTDPAIQNEKGFFLPARPANLSIRAFKLLCVLPLENHQSAATAWMNELIVRSLFYSTGFQRAADQRKINFHYRQNKKIPSHWGGLITLHHTVLFTKHQSRRLFGRTPKQLSRDLVMQNAMKDLIYSSKTLDELARQSGYRSKEFFITAFKKYFGISPGRLRINMKALSGSFSF